MALIKNLRSGIKNPIGVILIVYSFLFLAYSCQQEENPTPNTSSFSVSKLTLDGLAVRDTLSFFYFDKKVSSVNWCTYVQGVAEDCSTSYTESRHYDNQGKLDVISGRWHVLYFYEGGLRKRIMAYYDSLYFSSTTLEYSGTTPTKIKVHFAASDINEISNIDLTFNTSGDLIRKTIKNREGVLLEEDLIEYTNIENPLQGLKETISHAVEFFDFDDLIFYYSKHVPKTIVNPVPSSPGHPILQHSIRYEYSQDASGKLVSANAFYNDINVHNIFITYNH